MIDKNDNCIMCTDGLKPYNGTCEESDSCSTEDCNLCIVKAGVESCYLCESGLAVFNEKDDSDEEIDQTCVLQNANTLHCRETLFEDKTNCSECLPNYFYALGGCVKSNYSTLNFNYDEHDFIPHVFLCLLFLLR